MDSIKIRGGIPLNGDIYISGAKNAVLPIMTACLLTSETLNIKNIPDLVDVTSLKNILHSFGVDMIHDKEKKNLSLAATNLHSHIADYDMVRKMRASILVLGPLLARTGFAEV